MKVRIRKKPAAWPYVVIWYVEIRKWYNPDWIVVEVFGGDDAEAKAMQCAKEYANPKIIEVKT